MAPFSFSTGTQVLVLSVTVGFLLLSLFLLNSGNGLVSTGMATTITSKKESARLGVTYVHDQLWFDRQARAGCCPYAVELYQHRYGGELHYRCCTNRLDEIEPWRPLFTWQPSNAPAEDPDALWTNGFSFLHNSSILMQGDSLSEQYFIGTLCYFWYMGESSPVQVSNLTLVEQKDPMFVNVGTTWQATLTFPKGTAATIQWVRWNDITNQPVDPNPTYVIAGGWHHGKVGKPQVNAFLGKLQAARKASDNKHTFVMQALPSHFPGGGYDPYDNYPRVQVWDNLTRQYTPDTALCNSYQYGGDPDVNQHLDVWKKLRPKTSLTIVQVAELYRHRGDAHIGDRPIVNVGHAGRDCMHWCVAPGVLDAVAMQTLATLYNYHQERNDLNLEARTEETQT